MILNEHRKFIFIEVPKTGTSSVAKRLLELDSGSVRNEIRGEDGTVRRVRTHVPVSEVRRILGARADEFAYVAFLRDPVDLALSKYHFFRQGRAAKRSAWGDGNTGRWLRVRLANSLGIVPWLLVFPFRSAGWYVEDGDDWTVPHLGDFSNLQAEFVRIFVGFGYRPEELRLPELNRTEYPALPARRRQYVERIVEVRYAGDRRRYEAIRSRVV